MADQEFKIQIISEADVSGFKDAAAASGGLTEAIKTSAKVDAEATEATEKFSASKKQLKEITKELQREFPLLGNAVRMMINPVVLASAAIVGSLSVIWDKLKSVGQVMETTGWKHEEINRAAAAWNAYAEAVSKVDTNAAGLAAKMSSIAFNMKLIQDIAKTQGADLENNPLFARREEEQKAQALSFEAANQRIEADRLRRGAKGARPGASAQYDAETQRGLDEEAGKAKAQIDKLNEEIAKIEEAYAPGNRGLGRYTPEHLRFAAKYGAGTDPEKIVEQLKKERSGYQGFVDRADSNRSTNEERAAARAAADAAEKKAAELEANANRLQREAQTTLERGRTSYYAGAVAQGVTPPVTSGGQGWSVTPQTKAEFDKANRELEAIGRSWAAAVAAMHAQIKAGVNNSR